MIKMRYLFLICFITIFLTNCTTGSSTISKGIENKSFLEFVSSNTEYKDGVEVSVDETKFKAVVNKADEKPKSGTVYSITTGKHLITVIYKSKVIYSNQIFVSAQETKQIILP